MYEETQQDLGEENPVPEMPEGYDEAQSLRDRLDKMGVKYHHKAGVDKLRTILADATKEPEPDVPDTDEKVKGEPKDIPVTLAGKVNENGTLTKEQNARRLIRVRVTCMNSNKRDWNGEIFAVGNRKFGNIKKFVPFDVTEGWHVPRVLVDVIKSRQMQTFYEERLPNGNKVRRGKLVPEFNVEELPALTQAELDELAKKQALNHSIDQ